MVLGAVRRVVFGVRVDLGGVEACGCAGVGSVRRDESDEGGGNELYKIIRYVLNAIGRIERDITHD